MADLQFHSNHCHSTESARGTAEESRPQQDRDGEVGEDRVWWWGAFHRGELSGVHTQQSQRAESEQSWKCEKGGDGAVEKKKQLSQHSWRG